MTLAYLTRDILAAPRALSGKREERHVFDEKGGRRKHHEIARVDAAHRRFSPELNQALERLAERFHGNKSDVVRRALALMELAAQAKDEGKKIGIAEKDQPLATEIVGVV